MRSYLLSFVLGCFALLAANELEAADQPMLLKVGVAGLSHDHVHGILRRHAQGHLKIVGIVEPNSELVMRHAKRYGFEPQIVFRSIAEMIEKTAPDIVSDYGSTFGHLATVEACAPLGVDVMVEKPLAVSLEHVRRMKTLVDQHGIRLLTNYETTWYPSHHAAYDLVKNQASLRDLRKLVIHDGHPGPKEIGCSAEFLEWLTDPRLNGGGALTDFGCYGANLATWLMKGEKPLTVTAITQQIKPAIYPHVDDEATIILTYPHAQAVIQASWNWNYNRKDIEIYAKSGFVHCLNSTAMKLMLGESEVVDQQAPPLPANISDPYVYFSAVRQGKVKIDPADLSAFNNNMTVVEILAAAKFSAKESRTVRLSEFLAD